MIAHDVPVARPITRGLARAAGGLLAGRRAVAAFMLTALIFAFAAEANAQVQGDAELNMPSVCPAGSPCSSLIVADPSASDGQQQTEGQICVIHTVRPEPQSLNGDPGSASHREFDQPQTLVALCRGAQMVLGDADQFRVYDNLRLGLVAVVVERMARKRIILLSLDDEGRAFAEDISGDLAAFVGRSPSSGARGLEIDLGHFGDHATIGVIPTDAAAASDRRATASFAVTDYLVEARRHRAASHDVSGRGGQE